MREIGIILNGSIRRDLVPMILRRREPVTEFRYKAFLSYGHEDRHWARWLHRALETYRVPSRLVGSDGLYGEIPRRLHPIFRDREELTAHADLGERITAALEASEFLIVICSMSAARSRWVDQEILTFKRIHGEDRILSVIADGEPFASDRGDPGRECFPLALRFKVGVDGNITKERCEPVAADLRPSGDGRRSARLKLIAGMIGVDLDALVQRENSRRFRRQSVVTAASVVGMLAMGGLTFLAVDARDDAERKQAQAEGLIEFMIGDLRDKLEPVGRLEVLDAVGKKALDYYSEQDPGELDFDALGRRSRALHLIGEIDNSRGDLDGAYGIFAAANKTTAELLERSPKDGQRIYDHAQSVYWLGLVDWQRGNLDEAEVSFRTYLDLATQMVAIEPANADWQAELEYGYSNIGTLLFGQGKFDEARPAFEKALEVSLTLLDQNPQDPALQLDTAQSHAWLSDTVRHLRRFDEALAHRLKEVGIYQSTLTRDPKNSVASEALVHAWLSLGKLYLLQGNLADASQQMTQATQLASAMLIYEPDSTANLKNCLRAKIGLARVRLLQGEVADARREVDQVTSLAHQLLEKDATVVNWHVYRAVGDGLQVRLMILEENRSEALTLASRTLEHLLKLETDNPSSQAVQRERVNFQALKAGLLDLAGSNGASANLWQNVVATFEGKSGARPVESDAVLARALTRVGRATEAQVLSRELASSGFAHPEYVTFVDGQADFR